MKAHRWYSAFGNVGVRALVLAASVACGTWFVCDFRASVWRMDQCLHIRWNVTRFSDQYARIDKLGDEDLRRDYVTNFCYNACTLLNLGCKTAPNTSNLVERYYYDWDERIDAAESAKSSRHTEERK